MKIGILGVQGAVAEHCISVKLAFSELGIDGIVISVRSIRDLKDLDGLIIPGGESSTISRLLDALDLREKIVALAKDGFPIMGTCAGSILLADEGDFSVERSDTKLLGLMEMTVRRNAFGGQRESFEYTIDIDGIADNFPGVLIRAPAIENCRGDCKAIAYIDEYIVAAQQHDLIALTFHPELTKDTRIHQYFLEEMVLKD